MWHTLPLGAKCGTLYPIHVFFVHNHVIAMTELPNASLWHGRLAHMSLKGMKTLSCLGYLPVLNFSNVSVCEHCIYGKHARSAHKRLSNKKKSEPLDLVHSDVCGPMPVRSQGEHHIFSHSLMIQPGRCGYILWLGKMMPFNAFKNFLH